MFLFMLIVMYLRECHASFIEVVSNKKKFYEEEENNRPIDQCLIRVPCMLCQLYSPLPETE